MGNCSSTSNCNPCGPDLNAINQLATKAGAFARQSNRYAIDSANSAINAENAFLEFNALYLGAFAVAPTVDNEGNPLQVGALYWNTVSNSIFVWNGTTWIEDENFNEFTNFSLPSATPVPAANLRTGQEYEIVVVGNTNWTAIGAASATVGVRFTKNAVAATGAGTARVTRDLVTRFSDFINVADFGAKGDGVTDDTVAIQAAFDAAGVQGKKIYFTGYGPYLISSTIYLKVQRVTAPLPFPGAGIHFLDTAPPSVIGYGMPTIKATAAMTNMFEITNNFTFSTGAPFYVKIEGMSFDGNNLATTAIYSNFSMHNLFTHNRFWNLEEGIRYRGYGVANIIYNTFYCKKAILLDDGGGDTFICSNDIYVPENTNNTVGVYVSNFGGNTKITENVFSDGSDTAIYRSIAILIEDNVRDVIIQNNEFCGHAVAVKAMANPVDGIWRIIINGNHTNPCGAPHTCTLLEAIDCQEFFISNNFCNNKGMGFNATEVAMDLVRCKSFKIENNRFADYLKEAILMNDCTDMEIVSNSFQDISKNDANGTNINIYGASSSRNIFKNNYFRQTNVLHGKHAIVEQAGVDFTTSLDNIFEGLSEPHLKVGANSTMQIIRYGSAAPLAGRYYAGDIFWNNAPTAGGSIGFVCVTSGIPGTWKTFGDIAP